jgi:hypothetical protein
MPEAVIHSGSALMHEQLLDMNSGHYDVETTAIGACSAAAMRSLVYKVRFEACWPRSCECVASRSRYELD